MWQWWKCDNDVPEDYTEYHLNYDDGDGDDYWNDDDKWINEKILCWLSEVQVLLLPPVVSDFFPDNACDAEQCEWWCHPVGIECDRGDGRTKPTISHGQASPLWWLNIICEILHIISALRNIDPLTVWPLMNLPIKWNITRISSYRRNHASCQKSFPFQINIKKRYNVDHSSDTNKHFRNERLGKKCPQRCKKNWSPEKGVSHQELQEVSDPSVIPSFYQLTTEGKPCQRSRCQHTRCYF